MNVQLVSTDLGWFALLGQEQTLHAMTMGHATAEAATQAVRRYVDEEPCVQLWHPSLGQRVADYLAGDPVTFDDIQIQQTQWSAFKRRVVNACRQIPRGTTLTYGQLARRGGAPRAARAVGNIMAGNRFPLIVPCHRVVAAGGRLGGFSAPSGNRLKKRLLELEGWCG